MLGQFYFHPSNHHSVFDWKNTRYSATLASREVFSLTNDSSFNLQEFYVSASEAEAWGEDILGRDVLASGEEGDVTIADGRDVCSYDMRFVMDNGNTIEGSADLCETNAFTIND